MRTKFEKYAKQLITGINCGMESMEELICNIEFDKDDDKFYARLRTEIGGLREFTGISFDDILNQVMVELEEEMS
ncbi:hypothetical protein B2A_13442 [mine drainage metagenome]|uniref:Uncharacterized protein n=1 Tax=mine drainage metagenome TaxID=410659 RepID=T0ZS82_9ZZZZ